MKRITSNATLLALKSRDSEYSIPDNKVEGLNIRVRPTGAMSWVFRYQQAKSHQKLTMGRYVKKNPSAGMTLEQARQEASRYRGWLENGKDPKRELAREKRAQSLAQTFDDAFASFDSKVLATQLRAQQSRDIYQRDIKPYLGEVYLDDLKIADLHRVFDAKVDGSGKRMAGAIAACHKVINQVIKHAIALGMLETHPAPHLKVRDIGGGTKVTKRNLSFSELKVLIPNLDSWRTDFANIRLLKFLLGSGQRISAVLEMRWNEVDLTNGLWELPASSEERHTKSKHSRQLPLSDYLLALLREQREAIPDDWQLVWPLLNEDRKQEPAAIRAVIRRNLPEKLEHFAPHDLRRTFISRCYELGLNMIAIEKAVDHQLPAMLRVYNHHDYLNEQRAVLDTWGDKLKELAIENVIPFAVKTTG